MKLIKNIVSISQLLDVPFLYLIVQVAKIKYIESGMIGRICGSTEDKLMQIASAYKVQKSFPAGDITHIEIGTLFGGSTLLRLVGNNNSNRIKSYLIDPLKGFYDLQTDYVTNLPVDKKSLIANLNKFKVNTKSINIIQELSQSKNSIGKFENVRAHLLMIDGDHTYEGVLRDWKIYSKLVLEGGLAIIDDYNELGWPGITKFVDNDLSKDLSWKIIGSVDTTLVAQKLL